MQRIILKAGSLLIFLQQFLSKFLRNWTQHKVLKLEIRKFWDWQEFQDCTVSSEYSDFSNWFVSLSLAQQEQIFKKFWNLEMLSKHLLRLRLASFLQHTYAHAFGSFKPSGKTFHQTHGSSMLDWSILNLLISTWLLFIGHSKLLQLLVLEMSVQVTIQNMFSQVCGWSLESLITHTQLVIWQL